MAEFLELIKVGGIGGTCLFILWFMIKGVLNHMSSVITQLNQSQDEERKRLTEHIRQLTEEIRESYTAQTTRTFDLAEKMAEYVSNTAVALSRIASELSADRFCPFGKVVKDPTDDKDELRKPE